MAFDPLRVAATVMSDYLGRRFLEYQAIVNFCRKDGEWWPTKKCKKTNLMVLLSLAPDDCKQHKFVKLYNLGSPTDYGCLRCGMKTLTPEIFVDAGAHG